MLAQERGSPRALPDLGQVESIRIRTYPTFWQGIFLPNGKAQLPGPDVFIEAVAPTGSFSFEDVYNRLASCVKPDGSVDQDMAVSFDIVGQEINYSWYIAPTEENKAVVRTLMCELRDKAMPSSKEKFEELLSRIPFISGDPPVPFTYGEGVDGVAYVAARDGLTREEVLKGANPKGQEPEKEQPVPVREQPVTPPEEPPAKATAEPTPVAGEDGSPEPPAPPPRLWLYSGILAALCAGVALWLMRRKR
jgi:hypothetical protein